MISFFVAGVPVPKGSAKAFMRHGAKFPTVMQDNAEKQKPWSSSIGYAAQQAGVNNVAPGPVGIRMRFVMPRLKSHYGTGKNSGNLKNTAPIRHYCKPDLDKLIRCVNDALTGIAWNDDSMVARIDASKEYGDNPGVFITLERL